MTVSVFCRRVCIFKVCDGKGGKMAHQVKELAAKPEGPIRVHPQVHMVDGEEESSEIMHKAHTHMHAHRSTR